MKIAISSDHTGFNTLPGMAAFLTELGHQAVNFGPTKLDTDDDYPDFVTPAAQAVGEGDCERGIIWGGSGQGEAMAANRVKGVRCAVYYGPVMPSAPIDKEGHMATDAYEIIRLSRRHNDANMLSIAARFVSVTEAKRAIQLWLDTPFSDEERHVRRNHKLDEV